MRACVRACVRPCVRACARAHARMHDTCVRVSALVCTVCAHTCVCVLTTATVHGVNIWVMCVVGQGRTHQLLFFVFCFVRNKIHQKVRGKRLFGEPNHFFHALPVCVRLKAYLQSVSLSPVYLSHLAPSFPLPVRT